MRTRLMKMKDYGVTEDQKLEALKEMREENRREKVLEMCKDGVPQGIVVPVYKYLTESSSYDELSEIMYIPISKDDFYGYCRKMIAEWIKKNRF